MNSTFSIEKLKILFWERNIKMEIEFNNIFRQDKIIIDKIIKGIKSIIKKSNFILGEEVKKFEKSFSKFTKTKYCIGCANGSDALFLAIKSLNLKK